jgi:RNA polymerase sigma factor (sigma-70 family)
MDRSSDSRKAGSPRLYVLPAPQPPLPAAVPVLRPDALATPAEEALLTGIARRAKRGDRAARDLLWRAFAPRLEAALRRCGRMAWRHGWTRRDGCPWELDDLRQEGWRVFAELIADWNGEGSIVPYLTAYLPWRLQNAMRRLGPPRFRPLTAPTVEPVAECRELLDAEAEALLAEILAALSPEEEAVLALRLWEGATLGEVSRRLGVPRRTLNRRWERIRQVTRQVLEES